MIKKIKSLFIAFIITLFIILIISLIIANYVSAPFVKSIEISESKRFENEAIFNIEIDNYFFKLNKTTWCLLSDKKSLPGIDDEGWVEAVNGYCSFTVSSGDYKVYLKDIYGNINNIDSKKIEINKILEIKPSKENVYLYKGMNESISLEFVKIGEVNEDVIWSSKDENIATVSQDGKITGNDYGMTQVIAKSKNGIEAKINVVVSNFITKPKIDFSKSYVACGQFSDEDALLIDKILYDRIDEAGYGTRAGVIAAARFLTLEFAYRIHYFAENGRLENYSPYLHIDGEGRYYHRGLYLSKNKFAILESGASLAGPAIWGCNLTTFTNLPGYIYGQKYPNGLDCSGFVTWALLNGGFDIGDIGAGENSEHYDLDDLGTKVQITNELMNSGKVKVGDLIGNNGHMAILAGWDDNNYYIAESLDTTKGVVMTTVAKNKLVGSIYKHIILMDDVYKKDGNYSNMW